MIYAAVRRGTAQDFLLAGFQTERKWAVSPTDGRTAPISLSVDGGVKSVKLALPIFLRVEYIKFCLPFRFLLQITPRGITSYRHRRRRLLSLCFRTGAATPPSFPPSL